MTEILIYAVLEYFWRNFQILEKCIPIFNDWRQILYFCLCVSVYYEKNSAKCISGLFLNSAREKKSPNYIEEVQSWS